MTRLISDDMLIPQAHKTMFNFNKSKDKKVIETMFELYGYDDPQSIKELMNLLAYKRRSFGVSVIMKKLNQKGYIKNTGLLEKLVIAGILISWEDEKLGRLYCTERNNLKNFESQLYEYKILH